MSQIDDQTPLPLATLGWSAFFDDQVSEEERDLVPMRIATVHRAKMSAEGPEGQIPLVLPPLLNTGTYAVGDWVLVEGESRALIRRLERRSLVQRRTEGARFQQLIAANVDTLFIVTSCNDDLNPARLERYIAVALECEVRPVLVLTKADQVPDVAPYLAQVKGLHHDLPVVTLNATTTEAAQALTPWCGEGQTVALVGSSGVGKSSLLNTLSGKEGEEAQLTGAIREDDAKGRHTTTSRSLHRIKGGGWVIDTPGFRTLHISDLTTGLDLLFAEITERADDCRFRNCTHAHEPGCAVQAAIKAGEVDPTRLDRWRKLREENEANTPIETGARGNKVTKAPGAYKGRR